MRETILIVFKKEMTDLFRDRRTILMSILIPLLMYPIILGFMGNSSKSKVTENGGKLIVGIQDKANSSLAFYLTAFKEFELIYTDYAKNDVDKKIFQVALVVSEDFNSNVSQGIPGFVNIIYDGNSIGSQMTYDMIVRAVNEFGKNIVYNRLDSKGLNRNLLNTMSINSQNISDDSGKASKSILNVLLPFCILISCVTGPMAAAIDLGAGEKERGTLESLLATPVNRNSLLWGKILSITSISFISTLASLCGLIFSVSYFVNTLFTGSETTTNHIISPLTLFSLGIVAFLTSMVMGTIEFAISIFAKSFREAQTYLGASNLLYFFPIFFTYTMDVSSIKFIYFSIPLINISCLLKEFVAGIYIFSHISMVILWSLFYIFTTISFIRFLFRNENIVFRM